MMLRLSGPGDRKLGEDVVECLVAAIISSVFSHAQSESLRGGLQATMPPRTSTIASPPLTYRVPWSVLFDEWSCAKELFRNTSRSASPLAR